MINTAEIAKAVQRILENLGEDLAREGLDGTPERVAEMYEEVFSGLRADPRDELVVSFNEGYEGTVLVKDIQFFSMCEHHLLPFFGRAHVAYVPNGRVVGISKLARVVDILSRRLQMQERLTMQIADVIMDKLRPHGVAVIMEAEHTCMTMRGVKKPGAVVVTSEMRGIFHTNAAARAEVMALIKG
jgi:GTP cyclohydrolase I